MDRFTTARLTAERLDDRHLEDLVAFHLDADVSQFLGGVRSPETTRAYLAANLDHWDHHGFGLWVLRSHDGAFVGRAGVRYVDMEDEEELEIAYALSVPFWGKGLASEVVQPLKAFAFERVRSPTLVGVVMVGNTPSCRVLEKAGFAFERKVDFHTAFCDVYRLNNPAHQNVRLA